MGVGGEGRTNPKEAQPGCVLKLLRMLAGLNAFAQRSGLEWLAARSGVVGHLMRLGHTYQATLN